MDDVEADLGLVHLAVGVGEGLDSALGVGLVEQGADGAVALTGHAGVAHMQGAAGDEQRSDRAAAAVELRLDHGAFGGAIRVRFQVKDFGLQLDGLEQVVDALALLGSRAGRRCPGPSWPRR